MKKIVLTLFIMTFLGAPVSVFAGFYEPVPVVIPPMPVETTEGSAIASASFTASSGTPIAFSYNFISGEFWEGEPPIPGDWQPDVNDWFGVVLVNPATQAIVHFEVVGDVYSIWGTTGPGGWQVLNSWNQVIGPEGDFFLAQTGPLSHSFNTPAVLDGLPVQLGIGVFDLGDVFVPSALLIDNVTVDGVLLDGGDFETNPLEASGFFDPNGGPAGLFVWSGSGEFNFSAAEWADFVDLPGGPSGGEFAYISTFHSSLVPVPGAVWLLGSALVCLVGFGRKLRRS